MSNWSTKKFSKFVPNDLELADGGYWRVKNPPTSSELSDYYATKYFQENKGCYQNAYSKAELEHIRKKIEFRWRLATKKFTEPKRLLDVGCGEGFLLAHGLESGWDVLGLDFSTAGARAQNSHVLPFLKPGDLFVNINEQYESGQLFEIIWLQNVLEHVVDPAGLMRDLHALIAPDGLIVVTVPNDFSRLQFEAIASGRIDNNFWVALPDHLSYFGPESLKQVGLMTGWECEQLISDFPIDWFLFNAESNYVTNPGKGKAAHLARISLENLILDANPEDALTFLSGLARIGMGRDLTAIFAPV